MVQLLDVQLYTRLANCVRCATNKFNSIGQGIYETIVNSISRLFAFNTWTLCAFRLVDWVTAHNESLPARHQWQILLLSYRVVSALFIVLHCWLKSHWQITNKRGHHYVVSPLTMIIFIIFLYNFFVYCIDWTHSGGFTTSLCLLVPWEFDKHLTDYMNLVVT